MSIISLIIILIVIGAVLYIISLIPIDAKIKQIIYVLVIVVVAIWVLQSLFGGAAGPVLRLR